MFRLLVRDRGPRVTWAGMARSPMRLPRRPADSPASPLQHTHTHRYRGSLIYFFSFSRNVFRRSSTDRSTDRRPSTVQLNVTYRKESCKIFCRIESTLAAGLQFPKGKSFTFFFVFVISRSYLIHNAHSTILRPGDRRRRRNSPIAFRVCCCSFVRFGHKFSAISHHSAAQV